MGRIRLHKGGSSIGIDLFDNTTGVAINGLLYWDIDGAIYYLSNYDYLNGARPVNDMWKRFGYVYSYQLVCPSPGDTTYLVDINMYLPPNIRFLKYGKVVDPKSITEDSSKGEKALNADLASLKSGYMRACQITTSNNRTITGGLFRSKTGKIYVLHDNPTAEGTIPNEYDWREKSRYTYSWCLIEHNLKNDCKPETYMSLGPPIQLYDYGHESTSSKNEEDIKKALTIIKEHFLNREDCVGARVEVQNCYGANMDGILIKQEGRYYVLHNNPDADGATPCQRLFSAGIRTTYSWDLESDLLNSSQIKHNTFRLVHAAPVYMSIRDPMNPVAKSKLGGVVNPLTTIDATTYSPSTFEQVTPKNTEPELILFKKPTAKVTRCDVQPMQSPQIITKKKK